MNFLLIILLIQSIFDQLRPFLFQLFLFLWTLITPNINVNLIGHNPIIAELNRLMKPKTVSDVFGLLQFELHHDLVEVQNVELLLLG